MAGRPRLPNIPAMDDIETHADGLMVPLGWVTVPDRSPSVVATLAPRRPPASGLSPSVVLTRSPRSGHPGPLAQLTGLDPEVEDMDDYETELGVAHYLRVAWSGEQTEMLAEIWWWELHDDVVMLTARMARADFADYTEIVEEVAETFLPAA